MINMEPDATKIPESSHFTGNLLIMLTVLLIMAAELLLYAGKLEYAAWLHVFILMCLAGITAYVQKTRMYMPLQALMLLPLFRLVNISMPVFFRETLYLYLFIYSPLIIPVYLIAVQQKVSWRELGFIAGDIKVFIPVAIIVSLAIAEGEYYIIKPGPLIPDLSLLNLLKLAAVMIFFVGLVEELIFRSVLQTRLERFIGRFPGLLVTSILFGVMHSGYGTFYEMLFTSMAGLTLGYLFQRSRSLPLITLIHGMVNVFLFGIIPFMGPDLGISKII